MKKLFLLLHLTTLTTATLMIGLVIAGFSILQINNSLPDAQGIKSIELKVPLRVYSADKLLISEFGSERRKPIAIEKFPQTLIDAVLASEDDHFFSHKGIALSGLFRAAIANFRSGKTQQGASTITMQVARNFFLSREKTYIRKLREILLSVKLEQILSKNEILSLYLNKIFLGHRAFGFGAAADVYYGKSLEDLSLAEIATLAGLPKAPSSNNPIRNPERAINRRNYVLGRLLDLGKIDQATFNGASKQPNTAQKHQRGNELAAPHIAEMVRAKLIKEFGQAVYWQGLNVYTTIQSTQQNAANTALRKGLKKYDRRHGFRGIIGAINIDGLDLPSNDDLPNETISGESSYYSKLLAKYPNSQEQTPALVTTVNKLTATVFIRDYGFVELNLKHSKWAKRHKTVNLLGDHPEEMAQILHRGDIVYIEPVIQKNPTDISDQTSIWQLSQIPNVSGALISMEPSTGKILSLVGGYDYFLNKYNRAVQSIRQPGSNIKPFIYSASLEKGFTPASLISGAPIVITDPVHGTVWRPENYSGKFFGPTRMREGLAKSMNLVSIRLLRSIGIPYAREYVQRFGINVSRFSPTLTMALGAGGITPLEMLTAYSTLANSGYKIEPYFIDYITDRTGKIIYQAKQPIFCDECYFEYIKSDEQKEQESQLNGDGIEEQNNVTLSNDETKELTPNTSTNIEFYNAPRVMTHANNFLTVSMMKGVVSHGTARKALALNRNDLAGKTGTTNDYVDAWFTGFNSNVATTVWVGFDDPTSMGRGEAGSVAALPIWVDYMRAGLDGIAEDSTELPEYIEQGFVNKSTGERTDELDPNATIEFFVLEEFTPEYNHEMNSNLDGIEALIQEDTLEFEASEFKEPPEPDPILPEQRIIESSEDTEGLF